MRPWIEGLQKGRLLVRIRAEDVDPSLHEHSFPSLDLPDEALKQISGLEFVVIQLAGAIGLPKPTLLGDAPAPCFTGFRGCRLEIRLISTQIDLLRSKEALFIRIPEPLRPRCSNIKSLDLFLIGKPEAATKIPA